jgi:hypothetical protein
MFITLISSASGVAITYWLFRQRERQGILAAENEAEKIIQQARADAETQR